MVHRSSSRPNIVLITADSLRADHLGCYARREGKPSLTPNLDRLAARSVMFTHAFSQGPYTGASLPPLFTGRYPCHLKPLAAGQAINWAHSAGVTVEGTPTLPEILRDAGYHTAAFHSNPVVSRLFGFDKGFDVFFDDVTLSDSALPRGLKLWAARLQRFIRIRPYLHAHAINSKVLAWLATAPEPYFLWVHYMDTHGPYLPWKLLMYISSGEKLWRKCVHVPAQITYRERQVLLQNYRAQVCYLDSEVGKLIETFEREQVLDRSLLAFSADHGDEFFEHGGYGHRGRLYDELVHVPLIVSCPGIAPRRCDELTELIQIPQTALDFVGMEPNSPRTFDGTSFLATLQQTTTRRKPYIISEWGAKPHEGVCIRTQEWKLIWQHEGQTKELYDLVRDPREQFDVAAEHPEIVRELGRELEAHCSEPSGAPREHSAEVLSVSREEEALVVERLRDLGYL